MSMLDAFFNKGFFKAARCKTLLKLTIPRIKLLRNRREIQIRQMRKDIAKLLETGQEATARIRVEHIIREENMMAAQEIIELFCELVAVRLPIIESQRECPLDLKEAISSICFAAPRCSDLPELQQVQMQFAGKYGKEFVSAASELLPDCGVNRQIIELLSVRAPSVEVKMKLLKEIAEEHDLEWDPDSTEAEFLKLREDLLNGPAHFIGGSTLPLPKDKRDDSMSFTTDAIHKEHEPEPESDTGFDSLDLPEVPKVSLHPSHIVPPAPDTINPNSASSSEAVPTLPTPPPYDLPFNHGTEITASDVERHLDSYLESNVVTPVPSVASPHTPPSFTPDAKEKQFVPFVSPPPPPTGSTSLKSPEPLPSFAEASPSLSRTKNEIEVDLDDVLAAAHTAAETAERAAAAARAAASLAQVRISELVTKTTGRASENESQVPGGSSDKTDVMEKKEFDQQVSHENNMSSNSPEMVCQEPESPVTFYNQLAHQPSRSTSLEDDPYFSYPNLFGRQNSNLSPDHHK